MARIAPAKPNYNPRQFANTTFVDGEGWILTDPESGRTECLVSVSGTGWTVSGATPEPAEEEEEEEEAE
tara:strand:+ start:900 stop:1106 length:207 start_codon:yes stop_codon:yes gene_type:complete